MSLIRSTIKLAVFITNTLISLVVTYYWLHQMKLRQSNDVQALSKEPIDIQSVYRNYLQIDCWQEAAAILAIYLLVHYYLKSILLTIHQTIKWPASQKIIKCLKLTIGNFILYTLILGFLLTYIQIQNYQASLAEQKYVNAFPMLQILEMFIIGRLIFSFGFLLGTITTFQDIRAVGMGLTMGAIAVTIAEISHLNLLTYF